MSGNTRPLGLLSATALVVGSTIGSGVFLLPATLAPYGAASLLGWGVTTLGALLLAIVYSWLSRNFSVSGGSYNYARDAFGDNTGFMVAWSNWICMWVGNAALAVAFAGSLGSVFPVFTSSPTISILTALGGLWFCTVINLIGVREAGWVQMLTTLLKLIPLILFGALALFALNTNSFQPFNPSGASLVAVTGSAAAVTLWAFLGFEAATIPAGSVKDPQRNVPRATIIGMLIAGFATMLACTVVIGLLPAESLAKSNAPMALAATQLWGQEAGIAMGAVATISCFGALNGWVLLQAQVPMAAARDGLFPKIFAAPNDSPTPYLGLLISSTLAMGLVIANYTESLIGLFTFSILLSTAAALLPYAVSVAAWLFKNETAAAWKKLIAALALIYALWALYQTGAEALLWGAGLLLMGLPVLLWMRARKAS
jgi:basic amino acid/polyamine antiporter, APA family